MPGSGVITSVFTCTGTAWQGQSARVEQTWV